MFSFKTAVMLLAGFAVPLATAVSPVAQLFACLIYFIVLAVFAVCDMRNYEAD